MSNTYKLYFARLVKGQSFEFSDSKHIISRRFLDSIMAETELLKSRYITAWQKIEGGTDSIFPPLLPDLFPARWNWQEAVWYICDPEGLVIWVSGVKDLFSKPLIEIDT